MPLPDGRDDGRPARHGVSAAVHLDVWEFLGGMEAVPDRLHGIGSAMVKIRGTRSTALERGCPAPAVSHPLKISMPSS